MFIILLESLRDYTTCNDDLAQRVRKYILEPFQVDPSRPETLKKPPSPTDFKNMAKRLAPQAMKIVNQNIKTLEGIKRINLSNTAYTVAVNCLIDTTFCAFAALRHMSAFSSLESIEIEKSTSNLVCKMVDLGEYERSLDELKKMRVRLADLAKVQLNSPKQVSSEKKLAGTEASNLTEMDNSQDQPLQVKTLWENEMINKYQCLFEFPLNPEMKDKSIILLVLACQMNAIRCWCELKKGGFAKYVPYYIDKPSGFFTWSQHFLNIDKITAKQQLNTLQRILYVAANDMPITADNAYHIYTLQVIALKALKLSGTDKMSMVLDRMVRIGISYEKSSKQTSLSHIQKRCNDFLEDFQPNVVNLDEMDAYFTLCAYYAYVSKKIRSYKGLFYAYKFMIRSLREVLNDEKTHTYYYTTSAAAAKLHLGAVQMDKIIIDKTFGDITTTLDESVTLLKYVMPTLNQSIVKDKHTYVALFNLRKSIDEFKASAKRLFEYITDKIKQELREHDDDGYSTPPPPGELITPSSYGRWTPTVSHLNKVLVHCSQVLPPSLCLIEPHSWTKYTTRSSDVMMTYVEIMALLSRMKFNINNKDTCEDAYEYLSTAEQVCMETQYNTGYRWISGAYYNIGSDLIQVAAYDLAMYPIRKSCTLLEKDTERGNSEEGRVQLCKRYEILGVCSYKNKHFEESIKSYRLALTRIPPSIVEMFVSRATTIAVPTLMEQETLIPKLMDKFLRASVIEPRSNSISFASEFINLSSLSPVQQCIILECELKIWNNLALKMDLTKFQMALISKLLKIYDATRFPIRRARVILNRIRIERKGHKIGREEGSKKAIASANEVLELLKSDNYQEDINLLLYRVHYVATANSWIAICGRESRLKVPPTFTTTLQQWGTLLKKITPIYNSSNTSKKDIEQVYNSVDDMDELYDHLRMLSDLFSITGEYVHQICALRLLLKLNNGLRNSEEDYVSDSIILSSTLGRIYCDLGYTGKASVEFHQARNAVAHRPCSKFAELTYRTNHAYYLNCVNDNEGSRDAFRCSKLAWDSPEDEEKGALQTVKQYTQRCTLLADAYFTLSNIQASTSTLDLAIENAMNALQLLNKCIKVLQTADKEKQGNREFNNVLISPPPEPKKIVFRENQWVIAHKTDQVMRYLAYLTIRKGSWHEAIYFVKQVPLLAEKVNSSYMLFNSAICASDYHLRCGDISKSQDHFERATELVPNGTYHYFDEARLKSLMANLALANNYYDIALETFNEANETLRVISQPEYMENLESLIQADNKNSEMMYEEENVSVDCIPLQQLQSKNIIQKSKAMAQKGDIASALATLEKLDDSSITIDHIIELITLVSQWKLLTIQKELKKNRDLVSILPSAKAQPTRGALTKVKNTNKHLNTTQEALGNIVDRMIEAYRVGFDKEPVPVLHMLCTQLGYSMFLKDHIASSLNQSVNSHALWCSYFLSMANDITTRRELLNCLKIKTHRSFPSNLTSDSAWPPTEEDDPVAKYAVVDRNPKWIQAHLDTLYRLYRKEHDLDYSEFKEQYVDILPEHWTVCSLTIDPTNQDIYAVQLRCNEAPFVVKLPMNRAQLRSQMYSAAITYEEAQAELTDIINGSDETIYVSKSCISTSQVNEWWEKRTNLDNRLKILLENMESQWFSGFKGLMAGRFHEHKEELVKFQKNLSDAVYKFVNQFSTTKKPIEYNLTFCRLAFKLGRRPNLRDLEDLAYYTLTCYEDQGIEVDYSRMNIKQLTDQIGVLINRYHDKCGMAGILSTKTIPNEHVILILDKHIQSFPVESMSLLRTQSASRLPSLSLLRDRILYTRAYNSSSAFEDFGLVSTKEWKELTVSRKSAYYVLNPGGDLKDTQKSFEGIFKSVPHWDGIMGKTPHEYECKEALGTKDIYMYFGHSAGQAFMRGTTVKQLPTCAVSLLMGCSSGILTSSGEFDPYGYVLNFLLAGSPTVVSNLWDVTDKSIDKFTKVMLDSWGLLKQKPTSKSLVQAVTESRNACRLPYLIGAAPVVYGIPVYIDNN